jgi:predicted nucleotidyltransferase
MGMWGRVRGSRVYGLAHKNSDYDFLVVTTHEDEPTTYNKACVGSSTARSV